MKINELKRGSNVNIVARGGNKKIMLPTRVIGEYNTYLLVELIRMNDKVVDFSQHKMGLRYELTAFDKGKPLVWKNVYIDKITLEDNKKYHRLKCVTDSHVSDRRASTRYPVELDGYLQLGQSSPTGYEIHVYDVSKTGFGMTMSNKSKIKVGDNVRLTFFDNMVKGIGAPPEKVKFEFDGVIRRIQPNDASSNIVGMQIANKDLKKAAGYVKRKSN